jgi:hypothetical protein
MREVYDFFGIPIRTYGLFVHSSHTQENTI